MQLMSAILLQQLPILHYIQIQHKYKAF